MGFSRPSPSSNDYEALLTEQVDKHELCMRLSLPVRDLRILDPAVMTSQSPSSIFIRDNAIIFNIESLRMLIQKDEVILLSSPVAGQSLTASTSPTPNDTFVQELASLLDPVEAAIAHHSSRVETFLPYELRALEHGLATAVRSWEVETLALEKRTFPIVKSLLNKALQDILDDDEDIAAMYLGRKAAAREAAAARSDTGGDATQNASQDDELLVAEALSEEPAQRQGQGPQQRVAIASDRTVSAPPPSFGTQESLPTELSSAPSAPASQYPSREQADHKKTGRALWAQISNMKLAQRLINALQDEDLTDISACENLLESRNELVALDLFLTAVATVFAFVSMVGE
ncbi:hypothetical protein COCSUDRAFT_62141 [Coccomyxa subellipsoidea C-169]|uniref:Magnesium transporter n=1 Tax=Coccomyxa subellipsoidea (strain C-169) TaxID=574566 RepID=I0Z254_COCSC|nr:hypothetical protein COCSUDRAFT_62141 [Coccomyxa subellipsoidea C-169]EIE24723.1 hypothetical protein COCSUDRAFT_62141 [Coccomyxa subellipsoidea C-169]|eukprot:XP_005649267.1 hypothetical protein COCSUDRAFT_62141 [Coccomyxa subellipsoidea C-169]